MTGAALADLYRAYIACLNRQDWRNLHQFFADDARHNGRPFGLIVVFEATGAHHRHEFEQPFAHGALTQRSTEKMHSWPSGNLLPSTAV